MRIMCWDLEIAFSSHAQAVLCEAGETDLWDTWPFGISIAATKVLNQPAEVWFDGPADEPQNMWSLDYTNQFVDYLLDMVTGGYKVFTWNGTGFDYRLLEAITDRTADCRFLAKQSYDPCFQMLCTRGFPVGLDACGKAVNAPGKEMSGASAPVRWLAGMYEEVTEYVIGDVVRLEAVLKGILKNRGLRWQTKRGGMSYQRMTKLFTVEECLQLPEPDTSWMDKPIDRYDTVDWWGYDG